MNPNNRTSPVPTRALLCALAILSALSFGRTANAADLTFYGQGYMSDVRAIAISPSGEIWAGTSGNVCVFAADGKFLRYETTLFRGGQVNSIIFKPDGTPIFGTNDSSISIPGANPDKSQDVVMGGFGNYAPWEIALDKAGNIFATDVPNGRVMVFNQSGTQLFTFPTAGAADTPAAKAPFSLALDSRDRVYVTDQNQPGIWVYTHDGKFLNRLFPTTGFLRIKRVGDLFYATAGNEVDVFDPATGAITRHIPIPAGYYDALGFAIDSNGDLFAGNFTGGLIHEYNPAGTLIRTLGPAYKLTISMPDAFPPDHATSIPVHLENPLAHGTPATMPALTMSLIPSENDGENDLNFANLGGSAPDPAWNARHLAAMMSNAYPVDLKATGDHLQATIPADSHTGIYTLSIHAEGADPANAMQTTSARVVRPGATSSLTLFVPRQRSVFQQGERIEIDVALRSASQLPAGSLDFSLVARNGSGLGFQSDAPTWKQVSVGPMKSGTLTFSIVAADINPGRYVLQAQYRASGNDLRDVWPIQIVSPIQSTRFRILFPEWSAGYTDIWGPYDGTGMMGNASNLAAEGINQYDTCVIERGEGVMDYPEGFGRPDTSDLKRQAAADPALPAPERFAAPEPFEVELQEALRNHLSAQRDFWGSHFLEDWGFANPLSVPRDNRIAQLWTQWQREWPSWVGHRYLTLSIADEGNQEAVVIKQQLAAKNIAPPTQSELSWAQNSALRGYISDAPHAIGSGLMTIGCDSAGNIYIATDAGYLLKLSPTGKLLRKTSIPGGITRIAVTPKGGVWGAHMGGTISFTSPDGTMNSGGFPDFGSYSPRGVCVAPDGTLLFTDQQKGNIRRFSAQVKLLNVIGSKDNLGAPGGIATAKDGTIYVIDSERGGTMTFKPDGTPLKLLRGMGGSPPGGSSDICNAGDDTFWVTDGGSISHYDRDGKRLKQIGRTTFAPGGMSLPDGIALTPDGNLLVTDVALPYATEFTQDGDLVRLLASGTYFNDVRLDRQRYTFSDRIIASIWSPIPGLEGDPNNTLTAYAKPSAGANWDTLQVTEVAGRNYMIPVPHMTGKVTLRLVYAPLGATAENPSHADYAIEIAPGSSANDQAKLADIVGRRRAFDDAWIGTRMGTLVRWTQLSNIIRPGTQDTAPTNYGTPDLTSLAVWVPWRRDALVAEAENEGHDFGTYTLMGSWYVARALEGPYPKPAWSSLLSWYWQGDSSLQRPARDFTMLLGAGASGIGTGTVVYHLKPKALALHRKLVARMQRLGEATMGLELPGKDGVAVLHSYTEETMDAYNDEQFYAAQAAWYDLLRAHIPVAVTSEESIAHDDLIGRFKAVLIPYVHFALPQATMNGLARFQQAGGGVWVDLGTWIDIPGAHLLKTKYRPFWIEDAYYNINSGYGVGAYDGNSEYVHMKSQSDLRLPAIREAFGRFAIHDVTLTDPNVFEMERRGGEAVYDFLGNDHYPDTPLYKSSIGAQVPVPATAAVHLAGSAVYDAYEVRRAEGADQQLGFTNDEPGKIFVTLPAAIGSVSASASFADGKLVARAAVRDASGRTIPGVIPIEATITDSFGHVQYHLYRATGPNGTLEFGVPVGWMAPGGRWSVTITELLSNRSSEPATADVGSHAPAQIEETAGTSLVFDAPDMRQWLTAMRGQEVWIPLDKDQIATFGDTASQLAQALTARGINAKVIHIPDIPEQNITLNYTLAAADQAAFDRVKAGQAVGIRNDNSDGRSFRTPGSPRMIMRNLILLGDPAQNRWLADIDSGRLARRQVSPFYPGPGRALVQFCWAPFYDGFDAVTIAGTDPVGVVKGINTFLGLLPTQ